MALKITILAGAVMAISVTAALGHGTLSSPMLVLLLGAVGVLGVLLCAAWSSTFRLEGEMARLRDQAEETERQARAQVEHCERLVTLGSLSAGLAHELSQPLTCLVGHLCLLSSHFNALSPDSAGHEKLRRQIESTQRAAARMSRLLDHLRGFSRPSDSVAKTTVLNGVVDSALLLLHPTLLERGIDVDVDLDPVAPQVFANPVELEQVVLNLLANARDAVDGRKRRHIAVRTRADGDTAALEVEDSGPGVEPDLRERIFEPFFTTKRGGAGTGLGLSVSQNIAHRHGGSIEVENAGHGGARFRLRLPLAPPSARETAPEPQAAAG
jgi:C4-dicarboxylate-specific signal transduction histidine kinase